MRSFVIVLDSVGAGALPDAADYGDAGCHTIRSAAASPQFNLHTLRRLGWPHIEGLNFLGDAGQPQAAYGRMKEASRGKDTTIGHWELMGVRSDRPLPTYPNGFPPSVIDAFSKAVGHGVLCNRPYSGTAVIADYGERHLATGDLIVYTSADSVFQIAAHERLVPPETLYAYCRAAREILQGEHGVGRVIARPFTGDAPFVRTANRRDFSIEPPADTLLDALKTAGRDVIAVGKIRDIFAGRGVTEAIPTHGNAEGMAVTTDLLSRAFDGLCFVNLVDFDMLYGHRRDTDGYAAALTAFDQWLAGALPRLRDDDMLVITADHGCDPAFHGTDHAREYVPLLIISPHIPAVPLGTRATFADLAATLAARHGVTLATDGTPIREVLP